MVLGSNSSANSDGVDRAGFGFAIEMSSVPLACGNCHVAKVVVRQLPSRQETFSDSLINGGRGWPTSQEALAAGLARGRRYVWELACVAAPPTACADE
jgi:hypothetical protein